MISCCYYFTEEQRVDSQERKHRLDADEKVYMP